MLGCAPEPVEKGPLFVSGHILVGKPGHFSIADPKCRRVQIAQHVAVYQGCDGLLVGGASFRADHMLVAIDDGHSPDLFIQPVE